MTQQYWLADSEARVLGPIGLDVVRDLAVKSKLGDVRAVSRDGRTFVAVHDVPEIHELLGQPAGASEVLRAQVQATHQIRQWLAAIRDRTTSEVFRVPPGASREAHRAAFFAIVQRYVPGRLPPDATEELRVACEDAFLQLAERMVDIERQYRASAPPEVPPMLSPASPPPVVTWRGGMIHVRLTLNRGDARPFTIDPDSNWRSDSLFVQSTEKVMVGTPAEVTIALEGHVTQINAVGRVVGVKPTYPVGFSVRMLDIEEPQRSLIRTWVARSSR